MMASPHLAMGVLSGLYSSMAVGEMLAYQPLSARMAVQAGTAFVVGTASHLVLDAIPHNDAIYKTSIGTAPILAFEIVIITSAVFFISYFKDLPLVPVIMGFVGGAWLDVLCRFGGFPGENQIVMAINNFHEFCHTSIEPALLPNVVLQAVLTVIALMLL